MSIHVRPSIKLPGPYAAVVFDMDGLLVHTERQWLQAKQMLFERYGQDLTADDRAAVFGAADLETSTYFARRLGIGPEGIEALRDEYITIVAELFSRGVELTAGAVELIDGLSGAVPIALASNTRRPLVDKVLEQTPFADRFGAIVTSDESEPKPAPAIYLLACQRLGVDPVVAVAVEDSPTGVIAAKGAGMTCIGVPSEPDQPLTEADLVVASLTELL